MIDELRAVRDFRRDEQQIDSAVEQRSRAALVRQIESARGPKRRPRSRRRWLAAVGAPVAAATVAVAMLSGSPEGDLRPAPAVAQVLDRLATVAELRPPARLADGKFLYLRERADQQAISPDGEWAYLLPTVRETWIARDGRSRFVQRDVGELTFPTPSERQRWIDAGRPALVRPYPPPDSSSDQVGFHLGDRRLTYDQLERLPRDPAKLYRRLITAAGRSGSSPDAEAFVIVGDLLRGAPIAPDLSAALYRAAALIRGVRLVGETRDPLGRSGLAVEIDDAGTRMQLIFDPDTSMLLAERSLDAAGATVGYRAVVVQSIVDSDRARP